MRIKQTVYEVIPTGDYPARVESIEDSEGMYGPQTAWTFRIEEGQYAGQAVKAWCSAKFSPKSRLYQWTQAAMGGVDIPQTYDFDSADVEGRRVLLSIVVKVKEDGTEFSRVETVRKWRPAGVQSEGVQTFPPKGGGADDIPF